MLPTVADKNKNGAYGYRVPTRKTEEQIPENYEWSLNEIFGMLPN